MSTRLFVYGTLAPGQPNEHVLADLEGDWIAASVRGFLYEEGWGAMMNCPGIVPDDAGDRVDGFLFRSAQLPDHWGRLDEFEGYEYERVMVLVHLECGNFEEAFIYALKDQP